MKSIGVIFCLLWLSLTGIAQQQLFISNNGSDNNQGTKERPVATLQKAVELYRQSGAKGNTEIIFREGIYYFNQTVELNAGDSGLDKLPLVIKAYGDEEVVLDAGTNFKTGLETIQKRDL